MILYIKDKAFAIVKSDFFLFENNIINLNRGHFNRRPLAIFLLKLKLNFLQKLRSSIEVKLTNIREVLQGSEKVRVIRRMH